jgi:hypothetical protein
MLVRRDSVAGGLGCGHVDRRFSVEGEPDEIGAESGFTMDGGEESLTRNGPGSIGRQRFDEFGGAEG